MVQSPGYLTIEDLILTVTLNPAIDRTVIADRLVFEDRAYIQAHHESAGGRGINASQVLHSFGAPTLAILPSGGNSGPRLEEDLRRLGFPFEIVPVAANVRTNLILTDRQGLTLKLNEPGHSLSQEELTLVEQAVRKHLPGAQWLMLCGSLPPGVEAGFYRRLIAAAREHGVKTLVDTDGPHLQDCLLDQPAVVTPNRQEAATLLNKALITRQHFRTAAERIQAMGADLAVVSLGARGAIAVHGGRTIEATPPRIDAVSPIGAGDALNAALVWSLSRGEDFSTALRWGVAAGSASAKLPGIRFATLEQAREIYDQVQVR